MPDSLDTLPTNENPLSRNDYMIIDSIFNKENMSTMSKIYLSLKDIVIAGIVFLLFQMQFVDDTIKTFVTSANSSNMILLSIKTFLFMFVFFFCKNFYLSRKVS